MALASNSPVSLGAPSTPSPDDLARLEPPGLPKAVVWGLAIAGAVLFFGLVGLVRGSGSESYDTVPLASGTLTQRVTAVGKLAPVDQVVVGSDLTGEVLSIEVEVNDQVEAGDTLARLDPEPFESAVAQARASAASARANLTRAEVDLARMEAEQARTARLFERGAATAVANSERQLDVEAAKASVDAARASRDQAVASLTRAEQDLRDTVIVAPIDGVVLRRHVDEGQTVVSAMSATPLFEVASDLRTLTAVVDVDEADVGLVHPGQAATFTVSAWPDRTFDAHVATVDLAADTRSSVVVYGTELRVENPELVLRPGMTATAELLVGEVETTWVVPTWALRFRPDGLEAPDGDHVWTLQDGELVPVSVRVGGSDGALTAVYGDELVEDLAVVVGGAS